MGEVIGVKSECQHFSCVSAFRVANVSLLSLAQPSSVTKWGEKRQEGCGNDLVLFRKSSVCPT